MIRNRLLFLSLCMIGCTDTVIHSPQELIKYTASHEEEFVRQLASHGILYQMKFNPPVALVDVSGTQYNCDSMYKERKKYVYFKLSFLKDKNAELGAGAPDLNRFLQELSFEMQNQVVAVTDKNTYEPIDAQYVRSFAPNEGAYLLVVFEKKILEETNKLILNCQIKSLNEQLTFEFDPKELLPSYNIIAC